MWQGQKLLLFIQIQVAVPLCSAARSSTDPSLWASTLVLRLHTALSERSCPKVKKSGVLHHSSLWHITSGTRALPHDEVLSNNRKCELLDLFFLFLCFKMPPIFFPSCVFISQINFLLWLCAKVSCMFFIRSENSSETPWHTLSSHWWWHTFGLLSLPVSYHN